MARQWNGVVADAPRLSVASPVDAFTDRTRRALRGATQSEYLGWRHRPRRFERLRILDAGLWTGITAHVSAILSSDALFAFNRNA